MQVSIQNMSTIGIINLQIFWNRATANPFVNTVLPITEDQILLEIIQEKVCQTHPELHSLIDYTTDTKSATSAANKDIKPILRLKISILLHM